MDFGALAATAAASLSMPSEDAAGKEKRDPGIREPAILYAVYPKIRFQRAIA